LLSLTAVIATVVCLAFVASLLRMDRAAAPGLSKALWAPTVWFLYCASRPLDEWFQPGQFIEGSGNGIESGSVLDRYFLSALVIIGLGILHQRRINWPQAIRNNFWLFALLIFMLVSILWSDFPYVSLKRWVKTAGTAVMALVVLSELEPYEAVLAVLRRTVYCLIPFSMLLAKYYPRLGVSFGRSSGMPMYIGATVSKNALGEVCMLAVFFCIWSLIARRDNPHGTQAVRGQTASEFILMILAFFLIEGPSGYGATRATYSATSIGVLVVGLGLFFLMRRFRTRLTQLGVGMVFLLIGGGLVALTLYLLDTSPVAVAARLLGRNETLTGRSDLIWDTLLPIAWQNPVLGLGYGAFWITAVPGLTLDVNEAHNGYLDLFMELGGVGLILVALLVGMYFRKARREFQENFHWAAFRISYLVMFLLHNWTETTLLRSREILWNLFVVFAVVYPQEWTDRAANDRDCMEEAPAGAEESLLEAEDIATPSATLAGSTKNAMS
jgi:O-antigen ligase